MGLDNLSEGALAHHPAQDVPVQTSVAADIHVSVDHLPDDRGDEPSGFIGAHPQPWSRQERGWLVTSGEQELVGHDTGSPPVAASHFVISAHRLLYS